MSHLRIKLVRALWLGMIVAISSLGAGCGDSQPAGDETAKYQKPKPQVSPQDAAKISGKKIPKSIKDRS